MEQDKYLREQLGLTQREIAQLLGVSASSWAMYESGNRDLPKKGLQRLAELLQHASKNKVGLPGPDVSDLKFQLDKLLRENEYQLQKLQRQLSLLEKRADAGMKRAQVRSFLKVAPKQDNPAAAHLAKNRNLDTADVPIAGLLLEKDLALLKFEKEWLETKIGQLGK